MEKKDDGENWKDIIKKGLENLKIKESGIKGLIISEDSSSQPNAFDEKAAIDRLNQHVDVP